MASIYNRAGRIYAKLRGLRTEGQWDAKRTKYVTGQEREAQRYADAAQVELDKKFARGPTAKDDGPLTLDVWAARWIPIRKEEGQDWARDEGKLTKHILPVIGSLELPDITTVVVAELVHDLRYKRTPKLANRTVRNIYNVLAACLRDAAFKGLITASPCSLTERQLGKVIDKDPEWRATALFDRTEAEILISHPRIPTDRQLIYGFALLAGLRPGELAALRFRHYDPTTQPLGRMLIATSYNTNAHITKSTKTETTKWIPVHPTLAAMLAEWRLSGWEAMTGAAPTADDLLLPLPPDVKRTTRTGERFRGYNHTNRRWNEEDLPMLGWRHRTVYDTKSTFITLAIDDGADPAIIRDRITHTKRKKNAFDGYDRGTHFTQTCAELSKLRIQRRLVTGLGTAEANGSISNDKSGSEGGDRTPDPAVNSRLLYH
ncbi:hypothetical protein BH11MYX1_BH11MYX1_04450 [soil metagenome]